VINLSPETLALAHELADLRGISLEDAVRVAVEHSARDAGIRRPTKQRDLSSEAVAVRKARLDDLAAKIAKMPILDQRSPREIMDDVNSL
jgi:hypothetical protein